MDSKRIHQQDRNGGEETTTISIDSFSTPGKEYTVDAASCSCPHSAIQGAMCRHRLLFGCLTRIRRSVWGNEAQERHARHLVASVLDKRNGIERSYDVAQDAEWFRWASPELRQIGWQRHRANVARETARLERSVV